MNSFGAENGVECRAAVDTEEYRLGAQLRFEMASEMGAREFLDAPSVWRERFVDYFLRKRDAGEAQLFLAFDGATPVGCATVSILEEYRRHVLGARSAWVNAVYVKPDYRSMGIGKTLMQMTLAWARERGCLRVRLRSSEEGRSLYVSLGFRPTSELELPL